jgi:hypothetical protein
VHQHNGEPETTGTAPPTTHHRRRATAGKLYSNNNGDQQQMPLTTTQWGAWRAHRGNEHKGDARAQRQIAVRNGDGAGGAGERGCSAGNATGECGIHGERGLFASSKAGNSGRQGEADPAAERGSRGIGEVVGCGEPSPFRSGESFTSSAGARADALGRPADAWPSGAHLRRACGPTSAAPARLRQPTAWRWAVGGRRLGVAAGIAQMVLRVARPGGSQVSRGWPG